MAKQSSSYLEGFSGRLGPAVGYLWNGVWCVRSRPAAVRNPRTPKQMEHRGLFKAEVQLAAHMRWAVNTGLTSAAREAHMTAYNLFVSLNQPCFGLEQGAFKVDYAHLRFSLGPVAQVALSSALIDDQGVLQVRFDKNPLRGHASDFDSVYLYAYAPDIEQGFLAAPVYRRQRRVDLCLPELFAGHEVHLYLMVQNSEGLWSETVYGGALTVEAGCIITANTDDEGSSTEGGGLANAFNNNTLSYNGEEALLLDRRGGAAGGGGINGGTPTSGA